MTKWQCQRIAPPPSRALILWWTAVALTALGLDIWLLVVATSTPDVLGALAGALVARHLVGKAVDLGVQRGEFWLAVMRLEYLGGGDDDGASPVADRS